MTFPMAGAENAPLPRRPILLRTDASFLELKADLRNGKTETATIGISSIIPLSQPLPFTIRKNDAFDWLSVEPAGGAIGGTEASARLTVSIDPSKATPGLKRGLFLVRLDNGLSIPVTVHAKVFANEFKDVAPWESLSGAGKFKSIEDAEAPTGRCLLLEGGPKDGTGDRFVEKTFDLPADGTYHLFVKVRALDLPVTTHDSFFLSIDGGASVRIDVNVLLRRWIWNPIKCGDPKSSDLTGLKLRKGRHTFRFYPQESICLVAVALSTDPVIEE